MVNRARQQGLTIIELMIAIALMGLILTAMAGVLAPVFQSTKNTRAAVSASSQARDVLESIRAQWRTASQFNNNCAIMPTLPSGFTATVTIHKVVPGNAGGSDTLTPLTFNTVSSGANCPTSGTALPAGQLKRATVRIKNSQGSTLSEISLDMAQP